MGDADGGFGLVDVLSTGALRTHGIDFEIGLVDLNIDVFNFRQHSHGCGGGVDTARRFGVGNTLYPMHAGFELELGEYAAAAHLGDNFLKAPFGSLADRDDFGFPALLGGV